jgi:outer membrane protein TolC
MDVSKDRLNWMNTRSEMGAATALDGLQFENSLLLDSLSWLQQNASARESVSALNRLMGEDAGREWVLDSDLNEPENDWDFAILHQEVMGNATAIQNALISREIARVGVQQAKSRVSPKLLLSANQSDQGSRFRAGEITQDGRSKNLTANLTLSFNVFDGGATRRAIEQAYIQLAIAENRAEDERREVSQIVHDFWSRWTTARGAFFISRKIVANSDRALEIAKQRLASGGINSIDFREIQLQLVNARQQEVQSLNEWQSADIELRRLAGEWMFKSLD